MIVETIALLQHRIGLQSVRDFTEHVVPVLSIEWAAGKAGRGNYLGQLSLERLELHVLLWHHMSMPPAPGRDSTAVGRAAEGSLTRRFGTRSFSFIDATLASVAGKGQHMSVAQQPSRTVDNQERYVLV